MDNPPPLGLDDEEMIFGAVKLLTHLRRVASERAVQVSNTRT